jgi:hypothetical protein
MSRPKLIITKREAIRLSKKMWRLVLTGEAKDKSDAQDKSGVKYHCALCTYERQFQYDKKECSHCPLVVQLHTSCSTLKHHYMYQPVKFAKLVVKLKD